MQAITSSAAPATLAAGVVQTAVTAGGRFINHSEGVVVQTTITAGKPPRQHCEGVVVVQK